MPPASLPSSEGGGQEAVLAMNANPNGKVNWSAHHTQYIKIALPVHPACTGAQRLPAGMHCTAPNSKLDPPRNKPRTRHVLAHNRHQQLEHAAPADHGEAVVAAQLQERGNARLCTAQPATEPAQQTMAKWSSPAAVAVKQGMQGLKLCNGKHGHCMGSVFNAADTVCSMLRTRHNQHAICRGIWSERLCLSCNATTHAYQATNSHQRTDLPAGTWSERPCPRQPARSALAGRPGRRRARR